MVSRVNFKGMVVIMDIQQNLRKNEIEGEKQLQRPDNDSWKQHVKNFHDNNTFPYNEFIYEDLLKKLHKDNFQVNYNELVQYISTLGKPKIIREREKIEEERIRLENERIKQKRKQENESIKKLIEGPDFNFIIGFAKKFENDYETKDFLKLVKLINSLGYQLDESNIQMLLKIEIEKQNKENQYHQFVKKITHNQPENFKGYLENFYTISSLDNEEDVEFFLKFLQEAGHSISKEDFKREYELFDLTEFQKFISIDNTTKKPSLEDIDKMSGNQFENFLFKLFKERGYDVMHTPSSYDQGADLILNGYGETIAIQAKCYFNQNVGNSAVQEIVAAIKYYKADRGVVVTNSYFSQSAINLACSNNITLIDRKKLLGLLESDLSSLFGH